ncbi:hypothetical protein LV84_01678 [Algoriphagus ratkowskyi]|uniref:Lipoprotein n=1 Tax=Algoriphagus ratkowskyi TaxID=57028 RepID=A0A2W7RV00_9BACT|nr:hypothetical protein [Algoriphagus ratkowskyi]PZX58469.1 hypothetical protein LV84_01678 [Algoriphagus ratkowskyi]TXD77667.1 hypothetical protein ESW18_09845 [Algoriphagus ratkowskyi]
MRSIYIVFLTLLALSSCSGPKKDSPIDAAFSPETELIEAINTECFQYIGEKDTVRLTTHINGTKLTGTLDYFIFEKDKNSGTIEGEIRDGLIIAEYTFMSEGVTSKRQVVFKNTEDGWKEGYGEMKTVDEIPVQVNLDSLDYSHNMALSPFPCD